MTLIQMIDENNKTITYLKNEQKSTSNPFLKKMIGNSIQVIEKHNKTLAGRLVTLYENKR